MAGNWGRLGVQEQWSFSESGIRQGLLLLDPVETILWHQLAKIILA